ncbi:MAG: response regulator, partial [Acidobacteriota bacterium]
MPNTILLADDSMTIQKVVELTFTDRPEAIVAVGDGDEALARLDDAAPSLVVADVHMPGADGYRVCRETKLRRPGTPVLLLVGTFEPFDEEKAREAGADAHLTKPFDSQDLLSQIDQLLENAAAHATAVPAGAEAAAREPAFRGESVEPIPTVDELAAQAVALQSDALRSDALRSGALRSDTLQSDTLQSDTLQSDTLQSDTLQSAAAAASEVEPAPRAEIFAQPAPATPSVETGAATNGSAFQAL